MRKGMHARRRAVSPLLATVILIAITVTAGLFIYSIFFSTAGTMATQLNIQVVSVDVVKTGSVTLVSASIKNTGNKHITSCNVTFYGDDPSATALLQLGPIDAGQTKSSSSLNPSGFSVTVGKSYPVKISAAADDKSTIDKLLTITCTG